MDGKIVKLIIKPLLIKQYDGGRMVWGYNCCLHLFQFQFSLAGRLSLDNRGQDLILSHCIFIKSKFGKGLTDGSLPNPWSIPAHEVSE